MYSNFLTAAEREVLLALLSDEAPDYVLLRACETTVDEQRTMREDMAAIAKRAGFNPTKLRLEMAQDSEPSIPDVVPEPDEPVTYNQDPGGDPAARCTASSLQAITTILESAPASIDLINKALHGGMKNTQRLLKRLWDKKTVGFDGSKYYLN